MPEPAGPTDAARAAHEVIYGAGNVPPFAWEPVTSRLLVGRNPLSALDVQELAAAGVTHVVDLREPSEWSGPNRLGEDAVRAIAEAGLERVQYSTPDRDAPPPERVGTVVDWIDRALERPGSRVYVHCRAGVERTGTVILAWYAWREDLDLEPARAELARRAPRLGPLRHQVDAVASWLRAERTSGRRPFPRRRAVEVNDFVSEGHWHGRRPELPKAHVELPVEWDAVLEPWELRRVKLGLLPQEMEDKWLLVWHAPDLRAIRSWTGYEVFRIRLGERPDGTARWTTLLASREASQYTNTDPNEDLATASRLLQTLAARWVEPALEIEAYERAEFLAAVKRWSVFGAMSGPYDQEPRIAVEPAAAEGRG